MNTKSKIQLIAEEIECKNNFRKGLQGLMDKYNIEDSIFVFYNGQVQEALKGYFVINKDPKSLREAMHDINLRTDGIRIHNNKIQTGTIYNSLSNCPKDSHILDIISSEEIC